MKEPDFQLTYFSGRKCRKYARKTGFLVFSQDFLISFYWFFVKKCVIAMAKTLPIPILKKTLFWPKMPEICRKSPFLQTFSLYFLFFHIKSYSNSQYFVKIAGTANFRAGKTDFLKFLESYSIFYSWISALFFHSLFHSFARLFVHFSVSFPFMSMFSLQRRI